MSQQVFDTKVFKDVLFKNNEKHPNNWRGAGVAVPVFSLKSKYNFGVGEFSDLKLLADWCHKVGLKIIQILPVNDTCSNNTWSDSYPYKAISTKALHPLYLNLSEMGTLYNEEEKEYFEKCRETLNAKDYVDYPEVMRIKNSFFRKIFDQTWNDLKNRYDYINFFKENEDWLVPYAAFCYFRDTFGTSDFSQWGIFSSYDRKKIETFIDNKEDTRDIDIHFFLQYHLDKQLKNAVDYLHHKGIALKGDIPIGIGRHSVEAWTSPDLFHLNAQAGAPPDSFAAEGQNWGFPTYNWEMMANDNYKWWRDRLSHMSRYFDAYRIDHILGFFRIWEIPIEQSHGTMGYFNPAIPLSIDEIHSQGLDLDFDRLTKPYIRRHFLYDYFGEYTDEVINNYLNETSADCFELKSEYNNQRKIIDNLSTNITQKHDKQEVIKQGLLNLCTQVLFLKDKNDVNKLHPRIALQFTHSYNELNDYQKNIINKLYDNYFYHRNEDLWREEALKKLPSLISASDMMVCGEDLGMVPACVPEVMAMLNILSLEVQRMPKRYGDTFVDPANNQYLSVDTTSTHDTSTIRGWWEENGELTNRFYHEILGHQEGAPFFAEPYVCKEILSQHFNSSSMWVILPIQDYIAIDGDFRWDQTQREQINVPSNPENHWCYKMHQSLEAIMERQSFNDMICNLTKIRN